MNEPLELYSYKMAREEARKKIYTPPILRELEKRIEMRKKCELNPTPIKESKD